MIDASARLAIQISKVSITRDFLDIVSCQLNKKLNDIGHLALFNDKEKPWPDLALHKVHGSLGFLVSLAIVTLTHNDISITEGGGNIANGFLLVHL
ncbi:hypothetical protein RJT34_15703 [Clitoria ternatea]|uniref:Uncharacterized protein n=1 Tax=Clitoria ternatea TaxID=43366 RepID=A0AAN9PD09_CLITE